MSIELRAAQADDAPALAILFIAARRAAMPYLPELHSETETHSWMANTVLATEDVTVAHRSGDILGFSALKGAHLQHLYVAPSAQGIGIGSLLISDARSKCNGDLSLYVFQKNERARAFYEKHGFQCLAFSDGSENEEQEPDAIYVLPERPAAQPC